MNIIFADQTHLSEISNLANKIWPLAYKSILSLNQIDFMLAEMYSITSLQNQLDNNHLFKIAIHNDKIIGFGSYEKIENPGIFKIHKLYVDKSISTLKLGTLIVRNIENDIINLAGSEILLNVNRNNTAVRFYEKMGYQISKSVDIPFGDFILNDFIMKKSL